MTGAADTSSPTSPPEMRARGCLRRHGQGALLPYQLGPDKSVYVRPGTDAVIVYGSTRLATIVVGDPIGAAGDRERALESFVTEWRAAGRRVGVYQASAGWEDRLRAVGFHRFFIVGREAIIELETFSLAGPRRANLRHTVTRFNRSGGHVRWFPDGLPRTDLEILCSGLAAIEKAWRQGAGRIQLGFTIDRFRPAELTREAVAIAVDHAGRPIALVTFLSTGSDGGHVLGIVRRLPHGTPGAVESCIVEAGLAFRAAGEPALSLGLAPLAGLRGRGPLEERLLRGVARLVARAYDAEGLAFFKAKFDPRWEPRFAALVHRRDALRVGLALLRLHTRRTDLPAVGR